MLSRRLQPYLYLLPVAFLLLLVYLYPMISLADLSVSAASTVRGKSHYVGIENYLELLSPRFVAVIWRTLIWITVTTSVTVAAGLAFALLLNQDFPYRSGLRLLALVPWAIPQAITAILWRWLVHLEYGVLNHFLLIVGLVKEPISFLGVGLAFQTAMVMRVWHGLPFAAMTFLAALQAVPSELYEAAQIDGATRAQRFWHITLPSIRGGVATTSIILAIWSITTFDMLWVLTEGGPLGRTEILPVAIYREAFQTYDAGLASAMGVTSLAIILVLTVFYYRGDNGGGVQ